MTAAQPFPAEWTPEVAQALAKPFDPAQVGKLPRGGDDVPRNQWRFCGDCKQKAAPRHFHVDYVGHAVITDRLNSVVGPAGWSWTLLTVERDQSGRLLAVVGEMTVLGHTKGPETGAPSQSQREYGDALKSAISDYICRAAMRFGVALDLWAKQQLESATAATQESEDSVPVSDPPDNGGLRGRDSSGPSSGDGEVAPARAAVAGKQPATSPDSSTGDGPPQFSGPGAARAWVRTQPEPFRAEVEETVGDLGSASLDDLRTAIEVAWQKAQQAA
jgi:hypothetical protein